MAEPEGAAPLSRKVLIVALGALVLLALAGGAWYVLQGRGKGSQSPEPTASAQPQALPDPVILVLNRGAIMQGSRVGQDIARQIGAYAEKARAEVLAQQKALEPEIRAQKGAPSASLQARLQAVHDKAARDDQQIQTALAQARSAIELQLGPILKQVAAERHANLVLDKQAVPFATNSEFDVTPEVVARLDQKMTSYQLSFSTPAK
jgi:Skp family chaperone for outer membrane proteins